MKMNRMKPYDIGIITEGGYEGTLVIRTASTEKFEVMALTGQLQPDFCWTDTCIGLNVELIRTEV